MAVHLESEKIQTGPVPESAARLVWFMKTVTLEQMTEQESSDFIDTAALHCTNSCK